MPISAYAARTGASGPFYWISRHPAGPFCQPARRCIIGVTVLGTFVVSVFGCRSTSFLPSAPAVTKGLQTEFESFLSMRQRLRRRPVDFAGPRERNETSQADASNRPCPRHDQGRPRYPCQRGLKARFCIKLVRHKRMAARQQGSDCQTRLHGNRARLFKAMIDRRGIMTQDLDKFGVPSQKTVPLGAVGCPLRRQRGMRTDLPHLLAGRPL